MKRPARRILLMVQIVATLGVLASVITSAVRGEDTASIYDCIRFFALGLASATIPLGIMSLRDDDDESERDISA